MMRWWRRSSQRARSEHGQPVRLSWGRTGRWPMAPSWRPRKNLGSNPQSYSADFAGLRHRYRARRARVPGGLSAAWGQRHAWTGTPDTARTGPFLSRLGRQVPRDAAGRNSTLVDLGGGDISGYRLYLHVPRFLGGCGVGRVMGTRSTSPPLGGFPTGIRSGAPWGYTTPIPFRPMRPSSGVMFTASF